MTEPSPVAPVPCIRPVTPEIEAQQRAAVIAEAMTWEGTPYRQQAATKGGAVDCCMVLVQSWVAAGVFEPFDPRPYPPNWHMHQDRERYLEWLELAATEVQVWQPGDIVVWKFARTYSHSGIIVNSAGHVLHALQDFHRCTLTDMDEGFLAYIGRGKKAGPRPRKFFDPWAPIRATV